MILRILGTHKYNNVDITFLIDENNRVFISDADIAAFVSKSIEDVRSTALNMKQIRSFALVNKLVLDIPNTFRVLQQLSDKDISLHLLSIQQIVINLLKENRLPAMNWDNVLPKEEEFKVKLLRREYYDNKPCDFWIDDKKMVYLTTEDVANHLGLENDVTIRNIVRTQLYLQQAHYSRRYSFNQNLGNERWTTLLTLVGIQEVVTRIPSLNVDKINQFGNLIEDSLQPLVQEAKIGPLLWSHSKMKNLKQDIPVLTSSASGPTKRNPVLGADWAPSEPTEESYPSPTIAELKSLKSNNNTDDTAKVIVSDAPPKFWNRSNQATLKGEEIFDILFEEEMASDADFYAKQKKLLKEGFAVLVDELPQRALDNLVTRMFEILIAQRKETKHHE